MFRVTIKDMTKPGVIPGANEGSHARTDELLADGLVDDISLQVWQNAILITLIKRYVPFNEWAGEP